MKIPTMLCITAIPLLLLTPQAQAAETRIYKTDRLGNIQYNQPSYTLQKDGRVIETDPLGNKQYHKPQYQIKGDKIFATDKLGNIQFHKPLQAIKH